MGIVICKSFLIFTEVKITTIKYDNQPTNQPTNKIRCKIVFLLIPFLLLFVQSCSTEDNTSNVENDKIANYEVTIDQYFNSIEGNSTQEEVVDIKKLKATINRATIKGYDLNGNQKLLITDVALQDNLGRSSKTKLVFYLFGDKIYKSSIFVFQDNYTIYNYSRAVLSMLSEGDEKQLKYTGQVEIFSIKKKLEIRGTLQDGKLVKSAAAIILKTKPKMTARQNGCTDFYLVTTVGNTIIKVEFLYTACDVNSGDIAGGGSGFSAGGGSYSSGSLLILPANPQENDIHTYKDSDNIITTYKFINNTWKIIKVVLPDLVIKSGRESNYSFLNFEFPEHDQLVLGDDGLSYRYNSFSGNWTGNQVVFKTDPCSEINSLLKYNSTEANSLKSEISWLKDKVNATVNDKEAGVEVKKVMNPDETFKYEFTQVLSKEQFSIPLSIGFSYVGGLHSHPTDGYAMFSFQDIRFLLSVYDEASSSRKQEAFNGLVAKDAAGNTNTYMLKIENIESLRTQINSVWTSDKYSKFQNEDDRIKAIHQDQAIKYSKSNGNLEKSFLDQFKDFGIVLFKSDANTDRFDKLTLNNSTVTPTPCNQ